MSRVVYRSNYESFNWPIWFDEKHIYFRCYAGYIIKVDYLNGSIVYLLDFYYLGVTNKFKGLLIGEMKKFNNEKNYGCCGFSNGISCLQRSKK